MSVCRRRRPLSVRPSRRASRHHRPSAVRPSRRVPSTPSSSSVRPSVPSSSSVLCPSVQVRPSSSSVLCPSVRPVVRPVVVVGPLSARPVVRPNITCKTSRSNYFTIQTASPKIKILTPERPKLNLRSCWDPFGLPCSMPFRETPKSYILQHV